MALETAAMARLAFETSGLRFRRYQSLRRAPKDHQALSVLEDAYQAIGNCRRKDAPSTDHVKARNRVATSSASRVNNERLGGGSTAAGLAAAGNSRLTTGTAAATALSHGWRAKTSIATSSGQDDERVLVPLFERRGDVQEAYLARYRTGSSTGVVLCVVCVLAPDRPQVAEEVGQVFAEFSVSPSSSTSRFIPILNANSSERCWPFVRSAATSKER